MKIFAKRKRKAASLEGASPGLEAAEEKTESSSSPRLFQSDKVVEELLKQDPSTWNAKQRRMVKRYQERFPVSEPDASGIQTHAHKLKQSEETSFEDGSGGDQVPVLVDSGPQSETADDREQQASLGEIEEEKDSTDMLHVDTRTKEGDGKADSAGGQVFDGNMADKARDPELQALLDKLNSKLKRKLSRQLKRDDVDVEAVRAEAMSLLGLAPATASKESQPREGEESPRKKKKPRKDTVDLSTLTPEERMRREEQKRLQKEAAERRASGQVDPKFRHPLNSERRRANRRKPKHTKRAQPAFEGYEHDSSGYHMRRITKNQE